MTPPDDSSLTFEEVQDRFMASAVALEDVRARLTSLADLQISQEAAARGIEAASASLTEFASTAEEAIASIAEAQSVVVEAFAALESAMDGSRLTELEQSVTELGERLAAGNEGVAGALTDLEQQVTDGMAASAAEMAEAVRGLEKRLDDIAAMAKERDVALAQAAEVKGQLDRLKAAAGGRIIRKAGLEE